MDCSSWRIIVQTKLRKAMQTLRIVTGGKDSQRQTAKPWKQSNTITTKKWKKDGESSKGFIFPS